MPEICKGTGRKYEGDRKQYRRIEESATTSKEIRDDRRTSREVATSECSRYSLHMLVEKTNFNDLQLYHTKLEQLTNITHRLNAMARSLSSDFYSQDILEPTSASEGGLDTNVHRDVTPERFSRLEKELARGKAEVVRL